MRVWIFDWITIRDCHIVIGVELILELISVILDNDRDATVVLAPFPPRIKPRYRDAWRWTGIEECPTFRDWSWVRMVVFWL